MKNIDTKWLIVGCFILLFLPVAYYFCYALPTHNAYLQALELEKLNYQKEQDRKKEEEKLEKERKEEERLEAEQRERDRKEGLYYDCIERAEVAYKNIKKYCDLSLTECQQEIKDYNARLTQKYDYYGNSNERSLSECDKYKVDSKGGCFYYLKFDAVREDQYKKDIDNCERIRK